MHIKFVGVNRYHIEWLNKIEYDTNRYHVSLVQCLKHPIWSGLGCKWWKMKDERWYEIFKGLEIYWRGGLLNKEHKIGWRLGLCRLYASENLEVRPLSKWRLEHGTLGNIKGHPMHEAPTNVDPEEGFIIRNFILFYKRLFPKFESITSGSHDSNFIIALRLHFNFGQHHYE